jgi:glycosyltransferase involved in cell wall biosynthesis
VILQVSELEQMLAMLTPDQLDAVVRYPVRIVGISRAVCGMLQALGREDGVTLCPPAIDTQRIAPEVPAAEMRRRLGLAPGDFVWGMSGSIDPNKNARLFPQLAQRLLRDRPRGRFLWIKGGPDVSGYELYCRALSRHLGLEDRVIWTDNIRENYYGMLNACDALVLPSLRESFSIVTAEALWLGKPVAAFDCGGVTDVIPEGGGLIVPPYHVDDLEAAMRRIMDGGFAFDAARSRQAVARFDRAPVAGRWREMLAQLNLHGRVARTNRAHDL